MKTPRIGFPFIVIC